MYSTYDEEAIYQDADIEMAQMREDANYQQSECAVGNHGRYVYTNRQTNRTACSFCGKDQT